MNTPQTPTTITAMEHAAAMAEYSLRGEHSVLSLKNRSSMKFENNGKLDGKVLEAYGRIGFYVFENVIGKDELVELRTISMSAAA